jgi:hypothetical protein
MGRFGKFMPEVAEVLMRFPVAVLCCAWAFVVNFDGGGFFDRGFGRPETLGLMAAFFGGGAAHLFAEGRMWAGIPSVIFAGLVASAVGYLAYDPALLQSHRLFLILGLVLALFVAPYARRGVQQGAVWLFGMRLGLAALLAIVVGLTLMLGLMAIVSGLKFLFGLDAGRSFEDFILSFCIYFVGPLFGLAMVPRALDEVITLADHKGGLMERGVSVLVNYIAVPLAIVYGLLLHAYAVKIVILQNMPEGEIGLAVTLFAIAGTFAWLVAWPFRETGTRLLKLYCKYWFWFLPVPVGMLGLAVGQRVGAYGMTPDRYGLVLVALWAGLVCSYLMLRRSVADMRVIIGGAAVLLVLGSFGPLGAVGLTVSNQMARFERFLTENGMLEGGKLKLALPLLSSTKKDEGKALLLALQRVDALNRAEVYLRGGEKLKSKSDYYVDDAVNDQFGFSPIKVVEKLPDPPVALPQYGFRSYVEPLSLPFSGEGRVVGPLQYPSCCMSAGDRRPVFLRRSGVVTMTIAAGQGEPVLTFSVPESAVLKAIKEASSVAVSGPRLPLSLAVDDKTLLVITGGSGDYSDTKVELKSLTFWVVVRK